MAKSCQNPKKRNRSNRSAHMDREELSEEEREQISREATAFLRFYRQQCKKFLVSPSKDIVRSIQQSIRKGKKYMRLSLSHYREISYSHVQLILRCITRNTGITEILLNHNTVREDTVKYFVKKMVDNTTITSIELFGNKLGDGMCESIGELLAKNTALKRLKLGDNNITHLGASRIAQGLAVNATLIQLHLGGNKLGDEGLKFLSNGLVQNKTLNSLGMRGNNITHVGMAFLLECLSQPDCALNDIQLKGNKIGAKGCKTLGNALMKNESLKVIELQGNDILAEGVGNIVDGLQNNSSVHALNFVENNIGNGGLEHVTGLITTNQVITTLGLANNKIGRSHAIEKFAVALTSSSITGLDLGNNVIGDPGAIALGKCLAANKTITSLDLRSCGIRVRGMVAIAQSMEKNSTLCHLDLGSNYTRNKGALAWSKALAVNKTLSRLCLTDNQIYQEGGQAIAIGLQKNCVLKNFSYGGQGVNANRIDSTIRRVIDEIVKENKRNANTEGTEQSGNVTGYRFIDIEKRMKEQKVGKVGRHNFRMPEWLKYPIHVISNPMTPKEIDERLAYVFRSKLLKAENPKFQGFIFIGNILNTLHKVYPDTKNRIDEIYIVEMAYKDPKYYVHLSRELVKTQIRYVGYEISRQTTSSAPKTVAISRARPPKFKKGLEVKIQPKFNTPQPTRRMKSIMKVENKISWSPSLNVESDHSVPSSPFGKPMSPGILDNVVQWQSKKQSPNQRRWGLKKDVDSQRNIVRECWSEVRKKEPKEKKKAKMSLGRKLFTNNSPNRNVGLMNVSKKLEWNDGNVSPESDKDITDDAVFTFSTPEKTQKEKPRPKTCEPKSKVLPAGVFMDPTLWFEPFDVDWSYTMDKNEE